MTSFANSLIITHEVFHAGVAASKGYNMVSSGFLSSALGYYQGEGEHRDKDVDRSLTAADRELEALKSMEKSLDEMIDYYSRQGRYESRNVERPMALGQTSGAVWDGRGVCDPESIKKEILAAQTNVLRTVVTVPREWAPVLHLTTKEDWQALIRSTWPEFIDKCGIMPRAYQSWCAFYHTDNAKNIHCHVLTWDRSGCYFTGEARIPENNIETSKEAIRKAVYKEFSLERSLVKSYARDACVYRAKQLLGYNLTPRDTARIEALAQKAGVHHDFGRPGAVTADIKALLDRAAQSLPVSGIGRVGYASASIDARAAANLARVELNKDPVMKGLRAQWQESVERGADILGKHGWAREAYIAKEVQNLDRRLANAVLRKAADLNQPWTRSPELAAAKASILTSKELQVPPHADKRTADELLQQGRVGTKTLMFAGYRSLENEALASQVGAYKRAVIEYVQSQAKSPLKPEQIARLDKRVSADLAASLDRRVMASAVKRIVADNRLNDMRVARSTLWEARHQGAPTYYARAMLPEEARRELNAGIDAVKASIRKGSVNAHALRESAKLIVGTKEVRASIERSAIMASKTGRDVRQELRRETEFRLEKVQEQIYQLSLKESQYDQERETQELGCAVDAILRSAVQGRSDADFMRNALEVKIRDMAHYVDRDKSLQIGLRF